MDLMERTLNMINSELINETGEMDHVLWLLEDRPGFVGRLHFMPENRVRVRIQLVQEVFDLTVLHERGAALQDLAVLPPKDGWLTIQFFMPGRDTNTDPAIARAEEVARWFWESDQT